MNENPAIASALHRIPPLWPLKDLVAVNPFLGFSELHFLEAVAKLQRVAHGEILMPSDYYLEKITSGDLLAEHLSAAISQARLSLPSLWFTQLHDIDLHNLTMQLEEGKQITPPTRVLTFAEFLDAEQSRKTAPFILEEISKWCSVYYDEGQSSWRMPWRELPLYQAWREAALLDANPLLNGWSHFQEVIRDNSENPEKLILLTLAELNIPLSFQEEFLHRQLLSISGWSSAIQYRVREDSMRGRENASLRELLAVRLAYDLALFAQHKDDKALLAAWRNYLDDACASALEPNHQLRLLPRYLAHLALEIAYQSQLIAGIEAKTNAAPPLAKNEERKILQAVFCIDVRSEVYRRNLEAQSKAIESGGFAGFFGMPIEHLPFGETKGVAQCPVLLLPKYQIKDSLSHASQEEYQHRLDFFKRKQERHTAWNAFKTSAISCFSFVETIGPLFGIKLFKETLALPKNGKTTPACYTPDVASIPLEDQINLAERALRGMGFTEKFARLILLCGHGSQTKNNPYASGLDCGACGGHSGETNARVAALILNNLAVRESLQERGISIPEDTWFLAGLHNTTTDEVTLFDLENLPPCLDGDLKMAIEWLHQASHSARQERSASLGIVDATGAKLDLLIETRSQDWAEVRPEWGLANNAGFIVAPRERTRGISLHGRTFLHNYLAESDTTGGILELIMTAPMVVTNWINLQYYASRVNNSLFGSGNKTIHNIVGTMGIWQGNGGDLQVGLPMQSLHNGSRWMHEPLRLSVFIEAPRPQIDKVISTHAGVRDLIQNGWIHLLAIEDEGQSFWRYTREKHWLPCS